MTATFERHWYFIVGITLVLIYGILLVFFFRRYSGQEDKPVPIWWHLLLGPVVLLTQRPAQHDRKKLLTFREQFGWIAVVAILVIVVIWKWLSKL